MKTGIMQPYFFPYIGYFQLINAVDTFVLYDNIQFTKKGWINRNRILVNGKDEYITIPLKKDSDFLNIDQRMLASTFTTEESAKLLRKLKAHYKKAPEFNNVFPLVTDIINFNNDNLFGFLYHSIKSVCDFLAINTKLIISSSLPIDHSFRSQDKVIALCKAVGTSTYINPSGGMELYSKETFHQHNIELKFIRSTTVEYQQFNQPFVPWLSIIDVMMFNNKEKIKELLNKAYELV